MFLSIISNIKINVPYAYLEVLWEEWFKGLKPINQNWKVADTRCIIIELLAHFMPMISFDTPWKEVGFLMFSGGIQGDKWHEMS